ncbi:hypothetical protein ACFXK0_21495 [Nocardia sp. NPDC059177]|uniref:hypothetical protein n=1 Tax=Nocardia sp. NPDC059177 TaxID=3346759 RepID=UPI0036A580AA
MGIRELVYVAGLCVVMAVPACSHAVEGSAVAAETSTVTNDWKSPQGTWIGTYECSQGTTGLTLTVQSSVQAEFAFYPTPDNPTVRSGSFRMQWRVESGRLVFRQTTWIDRPGSYVMVDLVADRTESTTTLSGKVIGDGCTTFQLTRDVS